MKCSIFISSLLIVLTSGVASAASSGPYLGLGAGYAYLDGITSESKHGFTGRIFGGYNINQYFGVELGYDKFSRIVSKTKEEYTQSIPVISTIARTITYPSFSMVGNTLIQTNQKVTVGRLPIVSGVQEIAMEKNYKYETRLSAIDLVAKGYLPIADGFSAYVLGGAAYVTDKTTTHVCNDVTNPHQNIDKETTKKVTSKLLPKYGAGVAYDIPNTKLTTSLEVSHVQKSASIPSTTQGSVNVAWNFN